MADYGEDWLQRIVGVHWRDKGVTGAVFVYGMAIGNKVGYVKFKNSADKSPEIQYTVLPDEPVLAFGDSPAFYGKGVSFASIRDINVIKDENKPVFLLLGSRQIPVDVTDDSGHVFTDYNYYVIVYASRDGLNWQNVFEQKAIAVSYLNQLLQTSAIVWTPSLQEFHYSQAYASEDRRGPNVIEQEQVFGSLDGFSWSATSVTDANFGTGEYRSTFPSLYCSHNNCTDSLGQHVPDGVIWQDAKGEAVVRPVHPPDVFYGGAVIDYYFGENTAEIVQAAVGTTTEVSIPGIYTLTGIAGSSGVLVAGGWATEDTDGPGAIAFSLDGGKTWQFLTNTPIGVTSIVGSSF